MDKKINSCFGCMAQTGREQTCPVCGYNNEEPEESLISLKPGTVLEEKYFIGRVLGQGGFGITYLAFDLNLEIKLAIKEFFPRGLVTRMPGDSQVIGNNSEAINYHKYGLDRFLKEAKTLARFSEHPNIVNVRDYFAANGTAYMVMNFVEGVTLKEYLEAKGGLISFEKALKIMMPILDVLKEIHKEGILHRDISPDNIYIDHSGRVKLIDFGAARQAFQQQSHSMSVIMKVGFSPFEQYQSRGNQGPWTDIYAIAATMYFMVTGKMPPESLDRVTGDTLVPPSKHGINIEAAQERALLKALSVKGEDRYQNAEDFQKALIEAPVPEHRQQKEKVEGEEIFQVSKEPMKHRQALSVDSDASDKKEKPPVKKSRTPIIAAGLLSLLILAGLAFIFFGQGEREIAVDEPPAEEIAEGPVDNGSSNGDLNQTAEEDRNLPFSYSPANISGVQEIGCLFPLSGPLSTFGQNSAEVAKLAAIDVNNWLDEMGRDWELKLVIEDTQTEGSVSLRRMQSMHNQGIKFFAGPQASGEVQECLDYANRNQLLFISQSATSPALAIADDWLFRFTVDDSAQGPALAALVKEAGVENIILTWRNDTWGAGLQATTADFLNQEGVNIYQKVQFDPQRTQFSNEVSLLAKYVTELEDQGIPPEKIGIILIAFEEAAFYLAEAANYDQLNRVLWIGTDGTALSEAILQNADAADFSARVKMIHTMSRAPSLALHSNRVHVNYQTRQTLGREIDAYAYKVYDIIWSLALAIDQYGYDPESVKTALPSLVDDWSYFYGASGHIVLNEYGDRAFTDFDYWYLNQNRQWEVVGYYDGAESLINWSRKIY